MLGNYQVLFLGDGEVVTLLYYLTTEHPLNTHIKVDVAELMLNLLMREISSNFM